MIIKQKNETLCANSHQHKVKTLYGYLLNFKFFCQN